MCIKEGDKKVTEDNRGSSKPNEATLGSNIKSELKFVVDAITEQMYQNSFLPELSLNNCVQYFKDESLKYEGKIVASGFVLSVKKNLDPRNDNDNFVAVQGLVDNQNKPIVVDGETISRIIHTRTLDSALIKAMDGKETRIFKI